MKVETSVTPAKFIDGDDSNIPPSSSSMRNTHDPKTLQIASKRPITTKAKESLKKKKFEHNYKTKGSLSGSTRTVLRPESSK